jgi:hypothetical protein|nr:MAG TPA: hypothetical protein [Caudoviricetes sp.]
MNKRVIGDLILTTVGIIASVALVYTLAADNVKYKEHNDELKKQNVELIKTKNMYAGLNDRQKEIILEYKRLSGIDVTTVTKNLDNNRKAKELEEKVKEILEGWE